MSTAEKRIDELKREISRAHRLRRDGHEHGFNIKKANAEIRELKRERRGSE